MIEESKKSTLKKIATKFGVNKTILFTSSSSTISALGSILSALLVIKFLSFEEQGFYYTFGSIVAIQIFFELGLNGIITQFVAYEFANLGYDQELKITGNQFNKSRLSSLLHFCVKWYLVFSFGLLLILMISGYLFFIQFQQNNVSINWLMPWLLLSLSTALNLLLSPIIAFIQGLGNVKEIANFQLYAQFARLVFVSVGLFFGLKLYVLGVGVLILFITMLINILIRFKEQLIAIWNIPITEKIHYFKEIFPYQWKIALSWISGYFIFQLFNPVLFAAEGAKIAGQMGLTLTALNGILTISFAWMSTKVPLFSTLIANKKFDDLDLIFNRTLKQSMFINAILLLTFFSFIYTITHFSFKVGQTLISERFISLLPLLLMMVTIFLNQIVASWATYLRCHKKEPFLFNSIVGGILSAVSILYLGKHFGLTGITLGYFILNIIMFPWAYIIFKTKRAEWHL
jgi:O-antigen/teichoic acid export membrane protein